MRGIFTLFIAAGIMFVATEQASARFCNPNEPGVQILRTSNINDIHPDWAPPSFIGDSWNLIEVKQHSGGFLSGCLVSPRAAISGGRLKCNKKDTVFVVAKEWTCR